MKRIELDNLIASLKKDKDEYTQKTVIPFYLRKRKELVAEINAKLEKLNIQEGCDMSPCDGCGEFVGMCTC